MTKNGAKIFIFIFLTKTATLLSLASMKDVQKLQEKSPVTSKQYIFHLFLFLPDRWSLKMISAGKQCR
jgi:hypothetical protein